MSGINGKKQKLSMRQCKYCKKQFQPTRSWNFFCDPKCRWNFWDWDNPRQRNKEALKEANKIMGMKK